MPNAETRPGMTILIPLYNEAACAGEVLDEVAVTCPPDRCRILVVDDGSTDGTPDLVAARPARGLELRLLRRPHGNKDRALWAGIRDIETEWIGMMDGDGQYDPRDLGRMLDAALAHGTDAVWGVRAQRQDHAWRLITSRIARLVHVTLMGPRPVRDAGCGIWVARQRPLLAAIAHCAEPAGQVHCHLPDMVAAQGGRVEEMPITHRPRVRGKAKFGMLNRVGPGFRSLLQARAMRRALARR